MRYIVSKETVHKEVKTLEPIDMKAFLQKFAQLYEKQDMLSQLSASELLREHSRSEVHCINAIGSIDRPNTTKIAQHMNMTRGAISKLTKKLLAKELIVSYALEENRKEIYFHLTAAGEQISEEYERNYEAWIARDSQFFEHCSQAHLQQVNHLLDLFNEFLETQIAVLSKDGKAAEPESKKEV